MDFALFQAHNTTIQHCCWARLPLLPPRRMKGINPAIVYVQQQDRKECVGAPRGWRRLKVGPQVAWFVRLERRHHTNPGPAACGQPTLYADGSERCSTVFNCLAVLQLLLWDKYSVQTGINAPVGRVMHSTPSGNVARKVRLVGFGRSPYLCE